MGLPNMPDYLESVRFTSDDKNPNVAKIMLVLKSKYNITREGVNKIFINYVLPAAKLHGFDFEETYTPPAASNDIDLGTDSKGRLTVTFFVKSPRKRPFGSN